MKQVFVSTKYYRTPVGIRKLTLQSLFLISAFLLPIQLIFN